MTLGRSTCAHCGQDVIVAWLWEAGSRIKLDPTPVVGGDFTYWNPAYSGPPAWRAKPRPVKVSPPLDMPEQEREQWDGAAAADERRWNVEHVCGRTAEQIVTKRRLHTA